MQEGKGADLGEEVGEFEDVGGPLSEHAHVALALQLEHAVHHVEQPALFLHILPAQSRFE
jgi:hypothetical protein